MANKVGGNIHIEISKKAGPFLTLLLEFGAEPRGFNLNATLIESTNMAAVPQIALTAKFLLLMFRRYPCHASISFLVLLTSFRFSEVNKLGT